MTYEYPCEWELGLCRYYPIPLKINMDLYNKYKDYIYKKYPKITLCGRLGEYKYLNMDQIIESALNIKL
jgi:UDP-galactopyranose mutase